MKELLGHEDEILKQSLAAPQTETPVPAAVPEPTGADKLTLLGTSKTDYPTHPDDAKLECIPNAFEGKGDYVVRLECPEFTAVCPKTGQPDFAVMHIEYVPNSLLIESKALKLYLFAFRNVGMFHEFVVNKIAHDLFDAMQPKTLTVRGDFFPRGGISIHPTVTLKQDLHFAGPPRSVINERIALSARIVKKDGGLYLRPIGKLPRAVTSSDLQTLGTEWFTLNVTEPGNRILTPHEVSVLTVEDAVKQEQK